jgi:hypothetical protein
VIIVIRTIEALERAYLAMQDVVENLYDEAEQAIESGNYNDASLLQSQADLLFEVQENLGTVLTEMEESTDG